jgi:hypothetical protein
MKAGRFEMKKFFLYSTMTLIILSGLFCACGKSPSKSPNSGITSKSQAIEIASRFVPLNIASKARITASKGVTGNNDSSRMEWDVQYLDISATRADLGWEPDSNTELGPDEPYTSLEIKIDAATGELISRVAYVPGQWGGRYQMPAT